MHTQSNLFPLLPFSWRHTRRFLGSAYFAIAESINRVPFRARILNIRDVKMLIYPCQGAVVPLPPYRGCGFWGHRAWNRPPLSTLVIPESHLSISGLKLTEIGRVDFARFCTLIIDNGMSLHHYSLELAAQISILGKECSWE